MGRSKGRQCHFRISETLGGFEVETEYGNPVTKLAADALGVGRLWKVDMTEAEATEMVRKIYENQDRQQEWEKAVRVKARDIPH